MAPEWHLWLQYGPKGQRRCSDEFGFVIYAPENLTANTIFTAIELELRNSLMAPEWHPLSTGRGRWEASGPKLTPPSYSTMPV